MCLHLRDLSRVAVVGALVLAACGKTPPPDPRTETPLVTTALVSHGAGSSRTYTGVVAARTKSDLGFRVSGKVLQRLVDTGQRVHRGQVLMKLDPVDLSLSVTSQQGAVEAARARSIQAAADLNRLKGLVEQGAISAQQYDDALAADRVAKAQLNAAVAQAGVAKNANQYAELVADVDGVVINTFAEPGQVVAAGQNVIALAKDGPREAAVDLPESERPPLGSQAEATLYASTGVSGHAPAHLRELSDSADPQTRTFAARYVLAGDAANAALGTTVTVQLNDQATQGLASVPIGAIYDSGRGPGVWRVDVKTSSVAFQPVKLGRMSEEDVEITNGVTPGERVVALGAHLLHDHENVRLAPPLGDAQ
ncbi:efflux RND transporter periplasmic adaptor subunit [Paraburkholderia sediminicola]|uniref:efflux RND transporter periplasmic adaptor subunit n=1 Tax=Paraburkholderia sediminicola TaxID=458836 RepID=UPI0038BA113C